MRSAHLGGRLIEVRMEQTVGEVINNENNGGQVKESALARFIEIINIVI